LNELQKKFIGLKISLKDQIQEEVKEIREINKANETEIESILDQFQAQKRYVADLAKNLGF
jgi:septation ring formation regulator EzrA